ncbi:hypothetical protein A6R68_23028, partial [Neotoma lepida]
LPFCSNKMKETIMTQEKPNKLGAKVHIGGKGTAYRKKVVHSTATADDEEPQFSLKKLGVNNVSGIEEDQPKTLPPLQATLRHSSRQCFPVSYSSLGRQPERFRENGPNNWGMSKHQLLLERRRRRKLP